jgi:AraC-like DNA-binding protein
MADPCAEMVFHYKGLFHDISKDGNIVENSGSPGILQGPTRQYRRFTVSQNFGIFGAYLYPFAIRDLFGLSSHEIQHEMPSVSDCLVPEGRLLSDRILMANNNEERVSLLSEFLLKRLRLLNHDNSALQACIKYILNTGGQMRIEDTSTRFGISSRQLERHFKTLTGLTPKTYSRICRFQQALNNYGLAYKNLTEIAYECGYFDQSHFIHDFKEFSGYEPAIFFAGKSEGIEYRDAAG